MVFLWCGLLRRKRPTQLLVQVRLVWQFSFPCFIPFFKYLSTIVCPIAGHDKRCGTFSRTSMDLAKSLHSIVLWKPSLFIHHISIKANNDVLDVTVKASYDVLDVTLKANWKSPKLSSERKKHTPLTLLDNISILVQAACVRHPCWRTEAKWNWPLFSPTFSLIFGRFLCFLRIFTYCSSAEEIYKKNYFLRLI